MVSLQAVKVSQTPVDKFREFLATRPKAQRFTNQQRKLVEHIFEKHNHFNADQLIENLHAAKLKISRATVYRTLSKLVDAGLLKRIELGEQTVYDHDYGYPNHEHLVCGNCHKMIEFQHPEIENLLREVCNGYQFQSNSYSLIVRGICNECNRAKMTKRRLDLI
jgi:Fur family transcriptional regulator, ferric uptake regulator